jgi:hypothetical protein
VDRSDTLWPSIWLGGRLRYLFLKHVTNGSFREYLELPCRCVSGVVCIGYGSQHFPEVYVRWRVSTVRGSGIFPENTSLQ